MICRGAFNVKTQNFHTNTHAPNSKFCIHVTFGKFQRLCNFQCTETFRCTFACPISACQKKNIPNDDRMQTIYFCWSLRGSMSWKYLQKPWRVPTKFQEFSFLWRHRVLRYRSRLKLYDKPLCLFFHLLRYFQFINESCKRIRLIASVRIKRRRRRKI